MGYRSDVIIECNEKLCKKILGGIREKFPDFLPSIGKSGQTYLLNWQRVKWYDYFPEIKFVNECLGDHAENEAYAIFIIGEDLNDNTEEYSDNYDEVIGSYNFYISREFNIPSDVENIALDSLFPENHTLFVHPSESEVLL